MEAHKTLMQIVHAMGQSVQDDAIHSKSYGSIFSKKTNDNLDKWENYNPIKSAECDACKFLPICMGGCPYKSLNSPGIGCMTTKYNYRKFIDIIKKEKTRNRQTDTIV